MTPITFDMRRIGATIAQLRRDHNITQMKLADEIGVSFQAVSNWERGQSMPDISKLPELAELFGTTIDHLLGRKIPIIEAAAAGTLADTPITPDELTEAAPLLSPAQTDEAIEAIDLQEVLPNLPPFLSTAKADALMLRAMEQGRDIVGFLPFASGQAIDAIARLRIDRGGSIGELLPFMSTAAIDAIAVQRLRQHRNINDLLPFLSISLTGRLATLLSGMP